MDRMLAKHDLWWENGIELSRTEQPRTQVDQIINRMPKSIRRVHYVSRADTIDRASLVNTEKVNKK